MFGSFGVTKFSANDDSLINGQESQIRDQSALRKTPLKANLNCFKCPALYNKNSTE